MSYEEEDTCHMRRKIHVNDSCAVAGLRHRTASPACVCVCKHICCVSVIHLISRTEPV